MVAMVMSAGCAGKQHAEMHKGIMPYLVTVAITTDISFPHLNCGGISSSLVSVNKDGSNKQQTMSVLEFLGLSIRSLAFKGAANVSVVMYL